MPLSEEAHDFRLVWDFGLDLPANTVVIPHLLRPVCVSRFDDIFATPASAEIVQNSFIGNLWGKMVAGIKWGNATNAANLDRV